MEPRPGVYLTRIYNTSVFPRKRGLSSKVEGSASFPPAAGATRPTDGIFNVSNLFKLLCPCHSLTGFPTNVKIPDSKQRCLHQRQILGRVSLTENSFSVQCSVPSPRKSSSGPANIASAFMSTVAPATAHIATTDAVTMARYAITFDWFLPMALAA